MAAPLRRWSRTRCPAAGSGAGPAAELDADWFVACEAGAMRGIREHLRNDRAVAPERMETRGYWRRGEANYPDHDYGMPAGAEQVK